MSIDSPLATLTLDATPCCVAALHREAIDTTCWDATCHESAATLVNIIKLQNQVIKRQNAWHVLDQQDHTYLKTQLTNRDLLQEHCGAVLKQGYGALDALEAEAAKKKVEEEEKQRQKQQEREEKQCQKDEAVAAKAMRAAETTQQKLNQLAKKEWKVNRGFHGCQLHANSSSTRDPT